MNLKEAKQISESDPAEYVRLGLHRISEFDGITEKMLDDAIRNSSGNFFYYNFDKVPEFKKYIRRAAEFIANKNPLLALLGYRLNQRPEFKNDVDFAEILLINLIRHQGGNPNDFSDASAVLNKHQIGADVLDLVETIAKKDPKFYQESGLAEDPEYGKFFNYIGRENNMSKSGDEVMFELAKLLNKEDGLNKTAEKKEKCECGECEECLGEKKEKKPKAKKKKKAFADVLANLVKLAEQLDVSGAKEAASLVDDALKILVSNIKKDV